MPATFHAQCRPGSNSVTVNGAATPNDVRTVPVTPNASSVCGGSSSPALTVGPHFGHASRSTSTFHTTDGGAAMSLSTASIMELVLPRHVVVRPRHRDRVAVVIRPAADSFADCWRGVRRCDPETTSIHL